MAAVEVHDGLGSLKELVEQGRAVDKMPEMFCFGLLEEFDVVHLAALVAPRSVRVVGPSARAKSELAPLRAWNALLGGGGDPMDESAVKP